MNNPTVSSRHEVGGGIHGEWSAEDPEQPVTAGGIFMAAVAWIAIGLGLCVGAAYGF